MGSSNYVHVQVDKILRESEKAFLVRIGDEEHWLPKSQLADPDDYEVGDTDLSIAVTGWLANEKGLEGEE